MPEPSALAVVNVSLPAENGPYACPCCGYLTLDVRGGYEICPVCFWEDDGQDDHDAAVVRGGPNKDLSLAQARTNFAALGASSGRCLSHVRPPHDEEHPLRSPPTRRCDSSTTSGELDSLA
ncbi:CPCC family cysteine-rich protein [Kutzneria buriramensis]|uniref:CPCC family cysteine-rich protein n=1 Tax=Kutzneria buriramensis TaxID=1045776 RepID=UPI001FEA4967|nr:CPCC family cysteine-rich protein [Kutzneria buriramensis]